MQKDKNRYVEGKSVLYEKTKKKEYKNSEEFTTSLKQDKEKLVIGQLNINSIRNKFLEIEELIKENFSIFLVSETKIDESFPSDMFRIDGFSSYRLDRDRFGGGLLLYVDANLQSKVIKLENLYEGLFVEVLFDKQKWLIGCTYNPHVQHISEHLKHLQESLDRLSCKYDRLLLLGDLNCELNKKDLNEFCQNMNLKGLIDLPTCFKNIENPTCINHMLTNFPECFIEASTVETSISDFHKVIFAIFKNDSCIKLPPKKITYRCYKKFNNDHFQIILARILSEPLSFSKKLESIKKELENQAPLKIKMLRGNNSPFMTKELRKAIMERTRLKNIYLKNKTENDKKKYTSQRNRCVSLLRATKRHFFANIDEKDVTDTKRFWKTVKPFLSHKSKAKERVILIENNETIKDETEIANIFNEYFSTITQRLSLPTPPGEYVVSIGEPVLDTISKYRNHPSIKKIRETNTEKRFELKIVSLEEVLKIINELKSKTQIQNDLPVKIIKQFSKEFSDFMHSTFNEMIETGRFPDELKEAYVTPIHKKSSKTKKKNYRPISILPALSKVFERLLHKQISNHFDNIFSDNQCGFRKGFNTQDCLLSLVEAWKTANDEKKAFGALLIDLSKAFDCMSHELLITKLHAYGCGSKTTKLLADYLTNRKQCVRMGTSHSEWCGIETGVPQGSILGPLLFNIYICDLFQFLTRINAANYADDTTPYATGKTWVEVENKLVSAGETIFEWLPLNQMIGNADKCQLITNKKGNFSITIKDEVVSNSETAKILGVTFDSALSFEPHIRQICRIGNSKLNAIARMSRFLNVQQRLKILNAFFCSQFKYCPLVWMFHSRHLGKKIDRMQERCLRIVFSDETSSFQELLVLGRGITLHQRNIQLLAIELYKVKHQLSSIKGSNNIFPLNQSIVVTRNRTEFKSRSINSELHGKNSLSFLGPKIWELIPKNLREIENLKKFKSKIKHWILSTCPCRACRPFAKGVGLL